MLTPDNFRRIVRASAWYDLVITLPFATPPTLALAWSLLGGLQVWLGLPPLPDLSVYAMLFGNFFGTLVLIWSIVRLRGNAIHLGRYDAAGRGAFALWMLVALTQGASPLIWVLFVIEVAFGIAQALPVRRPQTA